MVANFINHLLQQHYTVAVIEGIIFGVLTRLQLLRTDYRQYPTYPHGKIIHISLGVIAAGLGAIAVPALLEKNYTAVTFLTVGAQQFRDVRNMERESLTRIDAMELVPRGATYIEGIAMVFEGRNYLVIFAAFVTSLFSITFAWYWGIAAGIAALCTSLVFRSGKNIVQIAEVTEAPVIVKGPDLYVGDIYIMNIGLEDTQKLVEKHGLGVILTPRNENSKVTLANLGQRQAILHDLSTVLGVYRDSGEPSLVPMAKLDLNDGRLAVFLLPQVHDSGKAVTAIKHVPVLESAVRLPSESAAHDTGKAGK
jgi:hypothetical protein